GKYILTYHKLFDGLINNCTAYDNGECSQCENGYQNNGTSCRDIRENTCDTYSGTTCTKCTSENLLAAGDCIAASTQNCAETDGLSTCTKCSDGNYLKSGQCETNPSFCNVVSNEGNNCSPINGDNFYRGTQLKNWIKGDLIEYNGKYYALTFSQSSRTSDKTCANGNCREELAYVCSQMGMRAVTMSEMQVLSSDDNFKNAYDSKRTYVANDLTWIWAGDTDSSGNNGYYFPTGDTMHYGDDQKEGNILCVGE
ncbi:hypothetical protein IJ732_05330, partial [bacterium]|nr:hypothetical protein [bacterium]